MDWVIPTEIQNPAVRYTVMGIVIVSIVIVLLRPRWMFFDTREQVKHHETWFRAFGVRPHQTVMPFFVTIILAALIMYTYFYVKYTTVRIAASSNPLTVGP